MSLVLSQSASSWGRPVFAHHLECKPRHAVSLSCSWPTSMHATSRWVTSVHDPMVKDMDERGCGCSRFDPPSLSFEE